MLRNREIRRFMLVFIIVSAAAIAAGFIISAQAGILAIAFSGTVGALFLFFTKARYQKLAAIADQIDRVLHSEDHIYFSSMDEGELSILEGEIAKMTVRLREQNAALKQEKNYLAVSLAYIAHQLRTPLTSANLILSLLKTKADESERRILLREQEALLKQMDWLVNSLLKLSRLDAGVIAFHCEAIDAKSLLLSAAHTLEIPMELHDISLEIHAPSGVMVRGDAGWLSEAVLNLLKNCMENTGYHGKIEVTCEDNALYTQLSIRDNGKGFCPEELPRVFDRFYRGESTSATGYGIGLVLSKSIITRQGGSISAKNHPQGGALFIIRFPK